MIRKFDVNNKTKEESTDLIMLGSGDLREVEDPLQEKADVMVWGKTSAVHINFCLTTCTLDPQDEVFDVCLI